MEFHVCLAIDVFWIEAAAAPLSCGSPLQAPAQALSLLHSPGPQSLQPQARGSPEVPPGSFCKPPKAPGQWFKHNSRQWACGGSCSIGPVAGGILLWTSTISASASSSSASAGGLEGRLSDISALQVEDIGASDVNTCHK